MSGIMYREDFSPRKSKTNSEYVDEIFDILMIFDCTKVKELEELVGKIRKDISFWSSTNLEWDDGIKSLNTPCLGVNDKPKI